MNNYEWLQTHRCNSLHITLNDHAANYVTAKEWIEEYEPDDFRNLATELVQQMKDTNTIWRLQIYPITPNGFNVWHGPTLDSVINQARDPLP